jgi:hypothetical protein
MQQTIPVCRECHASIHKFIPSEKELGRHFNSVELLLGHDQVSRFVNWVRQQR